MHKIGAVWKNAFRHDWHKSVKPLQYFSKDLQLSYLVDERQLICCRKLLNDDTSILHALTAYK